MELKKFVNQVFCSLAVFSGTLTAFANEEGRWYSYSNSFKNGQAEELGYFWFNVDFQSLPMQNLEAHVERSLVADSEPGVESCVLKVHVNLGTVFVSVMGQGTVRADPEIESSSEHQIVKQFSVRAVHEEKIHNLSLKECLELKLPQTPLSFDLVDTENASTGVFSISENLSPHIASVTDRNIFLDAKTSLNMHPKMIFDENQGLRSLAKVKWLDMGDDSAKGPRMDLNFFSRGVENPNEIKEELKTIINF